MHASAAITQQDDGFEACLEILLAELELAIRWDRPSLLLAVYPTEGVRQQAEAVLEGRLRALGQEVNRFQVTPAEFDVARILAQRAGAAQVVFFVTGLRWGGGRGRGNAYRALNLHREVFVEQKLRVVFWLTLQEASELPRRAPDFWAFRHRVVEFPTPAPFPSAQKGDSPPRDTATEDAVAMREAMLASLPDAAESQATRFSLLLELASLYRQRGAFMRARELSHRAVELAEQMREKKLEAQAWIELGLATLGEDDIPAALQACQRAIELDPNNVLGWESLGMAYSAAGQNETAIQAWQRSIEGNPRRAVAWAGLGDAYRALGRLEEARLAYRKAARLAPGNAIYWTLLGETLYEAGSVTAALSPLRKAVRLDEGQARAWETLARAYQQLGRPRAAEQARRSARTMRKPAL